MAMQIKFLLFIFVFLGALPISGMQKNADKVAAEILNYDETRDEKDINQLCEEAHPFLNIRSGNYFKSMKKVIRVNNLFAGYIVYTKNSEHGSICEFGIAKNFRGKGYGEQLLKYACDALKSDHAKFVQLLMHNSNQFALRRYECNGFRTMAVYEAVGVRHMKLEFDA